jgi:hypothetical protein
VQQTFVVESLKIIIFYNLQRSFTIQTLYLCNVCLLVQLLKYIASCCAAVWIDPSWSVGAGENSKEREVQTQRNRRDKETFYANQKDIPLNPKDPWDQEMDFDDSLTPEIPIEQQPDADTMETDYVDAAPPATVDHLEGEQVVSTSSTSVVDASSVNDTEKPDFELLAVLLKNPQLVFALTSIKGESMSSELTIALLDTLKRTGLELSDLVNNLENGGAGALKEPPQPDYVPASFPSPTPPSDLTTRVCLRTLHYFCCLMLVLSVIDVTLFGRLAGDQNTQHRQGLRICSTNNL